MKWTEQQYDAIMHDNNENILVSAGAGSGKTAILSERVIRKLKDGINVNQLLILTFTKAASEEMKERIRKKIIDNGLIEQLNLLDSSYITTFDSYALSMVKKYHYLLNIDKNISLTDESILKLERYKIITNILTNKYQQKEKSFLDLVKMIVKKDDDILVQEIESLLDKVDLEIDTSSYFQKIENINRDEFYKNTYNNFISMINSYQKSISNLLFEMEFLVENEQEEKYVSNCSNYYSTLIAAKTYNAIKISIDNMQRLSLPKKDISNDISNRKKQITVLVNKIKELLIYPNEQFIKDNFYKSQDIATTIIGLVKEIYYAFNEYKSIHNMYSFMDIAKLSIQILKENPEIAQEIKYSLNEIMIDEYQDTSTLQETFISYISNNNLYLVGDIKQSIYRFRYANPDLFKDKYANYKKHINGYLIDLNTNFRSRKEVLENINDIFSLIMSDNYGGANYKKDHLIQYGNKSFLNDSIENQNNNLDIYNYNINDYVGLNRAEIEAFIVANDIKNKLDNNYLVFDPLTQNRMATYKDFTILVDKRSDFTVYKKVLEYFNLPVSLYQNENIIDQDDLYCFKSILNVINGYKNNNFDTQFQHAFYSLAKSYLFSYSDNDILQFIVEKAYFDNNIYDNLKNIIKNLDYMSNYELFIQIIKDLKWYSKIIYKGDANATQARLAYLIKLAKNFDKLDYTFSNVINYFEDINERELEIVLPTKNSEKNAIKIMTIHNSKGLEFPICYFMGFDNMFNLDETKDNFILNKNGLILPFIQDNIKYHNIGWYEHKNDYLNEEISEKIRLLYVALTRAKEKMIIPVDLNNSDSKLMSDSRSFADFIIGVKEKLNKYISDVDIKQLIINPNYKTYTHQKNIDNQLTPFKYTLTKNEIKVQEIKTFSKQLEIEDNNEEILQLGTRLHDILFKIDFKNPKIEKYDKNIKNIITRFLNMPFLNLDESLNFYKEYEFYYDNHHGKIDLIIEYKDHYKIIDYKLSNIDDTNYNEQLKGYQKYLKNISDKPVKLYLYSLLQGKYKIIE